MQQLEQLAETLDDEEDRRELMGIRIGHPEAEDPFYGEIRDLHSKMAIKSARMRPTHRKIVFWHVKGLKHAEIAEKVSVGLQTVGKTLKRQDARDMVVLYLRLAGFVDGPTIAARKAMLWRIARLNEHANPRIAITAIDVLNKTDGLYVLQSDQTPQLPVILVQNFQLNAVPLPQREIRDITPKLTEGGFKPLTLNVPTTTD